MQYTLMHKDVKVADLELDHTTCGIIHISKIHDATRIPVGVRCDQGIVDRLALNRWWIGRSIPASRVGLAEALELMGVYAPEELLVKCFGLSLSDHYWICPQDESLAWAEVNFFDHDFSSDVGTVLFGGQLEEGAALDLFSPDNTSDGWLRKKWIVENGQRILLKSGSRPMLQEPLNEVFATKVMARLGIAHVPYELRYEDGQPLSACEDFITKETELIDAGHIIKTQKRDNRASKYEHLLNCCEDLGIPGVQTALDQMLTVDFLIANRDRHIHNFGAVRNADTLEWLGLAPIFDCGTALWHDQLTTDIDIEADVPSKPFKPYHRQQLELVSSWAWLDLAALDGIEAEFRRLAAAHAYLGEARVEKIEKGIAWRRDWLAAYIRQKETKL